MNCFIAQKMSLSEKPGCCFKCMTRGHRRDQCNVFLKCIVFSKDTLPLCVQKYVRIYNKAGSGENVTDVIEGDSAVKHVSENCKFI